MTYLSQGSTPPVIVTDQYPTGWWKGHVVDKPQHTGLFPAKNVALLEEKDAQPILQQAEQKAKEASSAQPPPPTERRRSVALFAYQVRGLL